MAIPKEAQLPSQRHPSLPLQIIENPVNSPKDSKIFKEAQRCVGGFFQNPH
jgi:hypothetical protein